MGEGQLPAALTLWAASLGFLNAEREGSKKTRAEDYASASLPLPLPDVPASLVYMITAFRGAGMVSANGMGIVPLPWSEIVAYGQATRRITEAWEAETLRAMSCAYLNGQTIGKNPLGIPPWETDE